MRDYVRLTGVLLIVCVVAAVVLGATNYITVDKIAEQAALANDQARRSVLSQAKSLQCLKDKKLMSFSKPITIALERFMRQK